MKFFQFYDGKRVKLGLVQNGQWIDLAASIQKNGAALPATLADVMAYRGTRAALAEQYARLTPVCLPESEISFAPVVMHPEKILCIGLNYAAHRRETGETDEIPFPPVFCKFANALNAHRGEIPLPAGAAHFDYEAELVLVIGKKAHCVAKADAMSYLFGCTAGNDFSARDLQKATSQWTLGKACDGFAPVGPLLVTADELSPDQLDIRCTVNGTLRQHSNTEKMLFSCAEIIHHLSQYMTLMPGDLIFTGTPEGVILGKPRAEQVWLKSGDTVTVEIAGIGALTNVLK